MAEKQKKRRAFSAAFLITLTVIFGCLFLFVISSVMVNMGRIPPELQAPPRLIAKPLRGQTAPPPRRSPSFPLARRVRGTGEPHEGESYYDVFIADELRDRPGLAGARLYLDLARQKNSVAFLREFHNIFKQPSPADAPLTPEQIQYLMGHSALVDLLLRFAESEGLPVRTVEDCLRDSEPSSLAMPSYYAFVVGSRILAADGRRRMQIRDHPGALRNWIACLRLGAIASRERLNAWNIGHMRCQAVTYGARPLATGILQSHASGAGLEKLKKSLSDFHREIFSAGWAREALEVEHLAMRKVVIRKLNGPWHSEVYGWFGANSQIAGNYTFDMFGVNDLPRLDKMLVNTLHAMRYKREAPRLLRDYDRFMQGQVERASLTYQELIALGPPPYPKDNPRFTLAVGPFSDPLIDLLTRQAEAETWLNLDRIAIEQKMVPTVRPVIPDADLAKDRENPWRDPFTERQLKIAEGETSRTLIYSLGPDLVDQRGAVIYDPSNGTRSAGDLVLGLP